MTKKEYCKKHVAYAVSCISAFACYLYHGTEYDINDYAYISYKTDSGVQSYHKLMIDYTKDGSAFVRLHGKRLYLSEFSAFWFSGRV